MATAPNVIVAGHPDLARKLRNTGRFPAVFDVASATALRELSQSGRVAAPATFMFGPDFDEDLPDAGVAVLANGLAASGFAVLVHSVFSERGDVFDPRVMADTGPLTMAQLLDLLSGTGAPPAPPQRRPSEPPPPPRRELIYEPPPAAWAAPAPTHAEPDPGPHVAAQPQPQAAPAEEPPPVHDADEDDPDDLPEYEAPEDDAQYEYEDEDDEDASDDEERGEYEEHEEHEEREEDEGFQDVLVAGEQGPPESREQEALPEYEYGHDHRDAAETRAEPLPFVPAETRAEPFSPDPAETVAEPYSSGPAEPYSPGPAEPYSQGQAENYSPGPAESYSPGPAETRAEPQDPTDWMWKETAPEPDHYAGPQPEADHYAAMPPGPGWQGGPPPVPPAPVPAQGTAAPAGSRGRGRIVLMAGAVFVLVAGLMAAAVLAVGPGKEKGRPEAATSPVSSPDSPAPTSPGAKSPGAKSPAPTSSGAASQAPTSSPTAVRPAEQYKPTGVRIVDSRISIEVSWKDASGGKAAYYVVGGPAGQRPSTLANTKQGATKVVVAALNPSVEYCLTVVAVVDVDRVAYAQPICTHRGKREG